MRGDGGWRLNLVNMLLVHSLPLVLFGSVGVVKAADLVIRIPGDLSQQDGFYRLDYRCSGWRGVKGFCVLRRQLRSCAPSSPSSSYSGAMLTGTLSNAFNAACKACSYFSMQSTKLALCAYHSRAFLDDKTELCI